jgi:[ribosomal protein S18]-alanine N-acetyltransferase
MPSLTFASAIVALMQEQDIDAALDIERKSNPHPWTREHFEDALRSGYFCIVARENDRVMGFAILRVLVDDAELLLIAVDPLQRRNGCATLLLNALIERMREIGKSPLHLEVRAGNLGAIAFYQARKFNRTGARKNYYPNGVLGHAREDAVLMQRVL